MHNTYIIVIAILLCKAVFICYHKKTILPIERELMCDVGTDVEDDEDNIDKY